MRQKLNEFAGKVFELDVPRKDKTTLREHVNYLRSTGIDVREFMPPLLPPPAVPIWGWFIDLCLGRQSNGMGPEALSFTEIQAWSQLRGIRVGTFELSCIRDLDRMFLKRSAENG